MRVLIVHNPSAGQRLVSAEELCAAVSAGEHEVEYRTTEDDAWLLALRQPHDLVAAAGGDGTVRQVFTAMADGFLLTGIRALATIVPLGTANNVARTLGISATDPLRSIDGWSNGARTRPYDLPSVTAAEFSTLLIEAAGGGLFAHLLDVADHRQPEAGLSDEEIWNLLRSVLRDIEARSWRIELDERDLSGTYLGVQAMNIRETGPNIPIAPRADPGDGLLDLALIRRSDREPLLDYVNARGALPAPVLTTARGKRLVMEPAAGCPLTVDDVYCGRRPANARPITITTGARHLRVLSSRPEVAPAGVKLARSG